MRYEIVYKEREEERIITSEPVKFSFAIATVNLLNRYKVNPYGDYVIRLISEGV